MQSRYGPFGRDVMQKIFLMGHAKISDLAGAYESVPAEEHHSNGHGKMNGHAGTNGTNGANGANGHPEEHPATGPLHTLLAHFLEAGLIEPVVESMLRSPADLYNKMEKEITDQYFSGGVKGAKQKEELKLKIQHGVEAARSAGPRWQLTGMKRKMNGGPNGTNGSLKQRSLSHDESTTEGDQLYEDDGTRLDVGCLASLGRKIAC